MNSIAAVYCKNVSSIIETWYENVLDRKLGIAEWYFLYYKDLFKIVYHKW